MKKECKNVRKSIQKIFDNGKSIKEEEKKHLSNCITCYSFKGKYENIISSSKKRLNEHIDIIPEPDFSVIKVKIPKKKNFIYKLAAAAVFVIAGSFLSFLLTNYFVKDQLLRDQNHIFVERLFNEPLFEIEYNEEILPSDWFDVTSTEYDEVNGL